MAYSAASEIVAALVTELGASGTAPAKTKLLKLLYLADLEHQRRLGRTLTGWDWIFHRFGPWTNEYDNVLAELDASGLIELKQLGGGDRDAVLLLPRARERNVANLPDADAQWTLGKIVARWARVDLPELLDYVYFDTEPMRHAERGERLNLENVPNTAPEVYRRRASDPSGLAAMRDAAKGFTRARPGAAPARYTPPKYDHEILAALSAVEDDD